MPNLPKTRQIRHVEPAAKQNLTDRRSLARAFARFTEVASSLERSYGQLQNEVARLRTELEQANSDLSNSLEENAKVRAFLTRILEGLPCGVFVTDNNHTLRMLNPEARRLLALDPVWRPEGDAANATIERLIAETAPKCFQSEQEWASDSIPADRTIGVSAANVDGAPDGAERIWILRDISDQKRFAAEREAGRKARALAEISTVLAHEIRNPLGSMELFAGLLANATSEMPDANHWATNLQAGIRSLSATVNNVLQFHSEPSPELITIRLDRQLRETVEFLGPLARQLGLRVELQNSCGPVQVAADPHRLQQVFLNLALNAFRAMEYGRKLTIRLGVPAEPANFVRVDFEDEGTGIEPGALGKIFEPGFTTRADSPGLGLCVCKKVIEQHGGSIRVASILGDGTTFTLTLPTQGGIQ